MKSLDVVLAYIGLITVLLVVGCGALFVTQMLILTVISAGV